MKISIIFLPHHFLFETSFPLYLSSFLIILPFPQLKSHPRKMMKINLINFYCLHSTRLGAIFRLLPLLTSAQSQHPMYTVEYNCDLTEHLLFFEWSARVRLGVGVRHVPDVIQKKSVVCASLLSKEPRLSRITMEFRWKACFDLLTQVKWKVFLGWFISFDD